MKLQMKWKTIAHLKSMPPLRPPFKVSQAQYCHFCNGLLALPIINVRWKAQNIVTCFKCFKIHRFEFEDNTDKLNVSHKK